MHDATTDEDDGRGPRREDAISYKAGRTRRVETRLEPATQYSKRECMDVTCVLTNAVIVRPHCPTSYRFAMPSIAMVCLPSIAARRAPYPRCEQKNKAKKRTTRSASRSGQRVRARFTPSFALYSLAASRWYIAQHATVPRDS